MRTIDDEFKPPVTSCHRAEAIAGVVTPHAADRRVDTVGVRVGAVRQVTLDFEGMLAVELGHVVTTVEVGDSTLVES